MIEILTRDDAIADRYIGGDFIIGHAAGYHVRQLEFKQLGYIQDGKHFGKYGEFFQGSLCAPELQGAKARVF